MQQVAMDAMWEAPGCGAAPVQVTLAYYGRGDRLRAAALVFATLLLPTLATAFVPVFHFFLVPAFFSAAVGAAIWRLRMATAALTAAGVCPACSDHVRVDLAKARPQPQLWTLCPACGERLRLKLPLVLDLAAAKDPAAGATDQQGSGESR